MRFDDVSPWIPRGLYLFGLALIITAAIDLGTTVWPLRITDMTWRYGFLGLAAGYLQTPMLGLVMIAATAMWQNESRVLQVVGLVCSALAVALLGAIVLFGLDVLAMRQIRTEDAQAGVLVGGAFQEVKYVMATLVFGFLGHGARKTAKALPSAAPRAPGIVSKGG